MREWCAALKGWRRIGLNAPLPHECGLTDDRLGLVFLLPGSGRRVHLGHRHKATSEFRQAKRASGGLDMRHNILRCMAIQQPYRLPSSHTPSIYFIKVQAVPITRTKLVKYIIALMHIFVNHLQDRLLGRRLEYCEYVSLGQLAERNDRTPHELAYLYRRPLLCMHRIWGYPV